MKKIFALAVALVAMVSMVSAQSYQLVVKKADGTVVTIATDDINKMVFTEAVEASGAASTYTGKVTMAMAYGTYSYYAQQVVLTDVADGVVNVYYNGSLGVIDADCALTVNEDGSFSIAETESTMAMDNHAGGVSNYACIVSGEISADDYAIVFYCPSVMGGTTFTLTPLTSAETVAGSYFGKMNMAMAYGTYDYTRQTVTITANSDGTINIVYDGSLGSCNLESVELTKNSDGSYSYSGEGVFNMGMSAASVKEYACVYSGTISADQSDYSIAFTLPAVMGGTTITLTPSTAAEDVAGDYAGTMTMAMAYGTYEYTEQTVTITANEDGTINIAYEGDLGSCNLENVAVVKESDGSYTYSGEGVYNMGMSSDAV